MSTAEGPSRRHDEESDPWVDESLQWRRCYDETEAELEITLSNHNTGASERSLFDFSPMKKSEHIR